MHEVTEHIGPQPHRGRRRDRLGKSTFAKLLTRLMDPSTGMVRLDDVDIREVRFASLRERVAMVPQEGFLFDDTVLANIRFGAAIDRARVELAMTELGLDHWVAGLPAGLDTPVGQRGEAMSAGSGNSSRSPGPISPTPTCWSWTRLGRRPGDRGPHPAGRTLPWPDLDHHRPPHLDRPGGG